MPARFREIIELLGRREPERHCAASRFLLDGGGEWRTELADHVDRALERQRAIGRPLPLSTFGDMRVTLYCWQQGVVPRIPSLAEPYAKALMVGNDEPDRTLLELVYTAEGVLSELHHRRYRRSDIRAEELPRLQAEAACARPARFGFRRLEE